MTAETTAPTAPTADRHDHGPVAGPVGPGAAPSKPGAPPSVPDAAPSVPAPPVGHAPLVLLLSSLGVALVAVAYRGGDTGAGWAEPLYWLGQVVVFLPVVTRLAVRRPAGAGEALLLVLGLAVNQYLLKWMYSPDQFRFPDELQHLAATTTILDTGELFQPNPALPVGAGFPGLAEMGAALAAVSGLSSHTAGLVIAGVARLVLVAALFALVRRAGGTPRLAATTCLVYSTGQHYLFFNAMYLYQTAALTFLLVALWAVTARHRGDRGAGTALVAAVAIAVVAVTHHITAFMLVATLVVVAVTDLAVGRRRAGVARVGGSSGRRWDSAVFAGVAILAVGLWIALPARATLDYFEAPARRAWDALRGLLTGAASAGQAGPASPRWQLIVQAAALLVLLLLLVAGVQGIRRWRPRDPWRYLVLVGGLLFFAGHALWFAGPQGPELVGRITTFTFLPMSMVAAVELVRARLRRRGTAPDGWRRAAGAGGWRGDVEAGGWRRVTAAVGQGRRVTATVLVATLLMVSARATGWPPWWERLPGPYRPGSFERSVEEQNLAAARFSGAWLGRGHLIAADSAGWILLASYGGQSPVAGQAAPIYYSPRFGLAEAQLVDRLSLEYLWVDLRMSEQTPASGAYFTGDPRSGTHDVPVPRASLTKFDELPGVDLVYDSGDIRIYDIRDL